MSHMNFNCPAQWYWAHAPLPPHQPYAQKGDEWSDRGITLSAEYRTKIDGVSAGENRFQLVSFKTALLKQAAIRVVLVLYASQQKSEKYLRTSGEPRDEDYVSSSWLPIFGKWDPARGERQPVDLCSSPFPQRPHGCPSRLWWAHSGRLAFRLFPDTEPAFLRSVL